MGDAALRFGRYEALFRIAGGGMAEVFAARVRGEGGFEKLVAVKRMLPHLAEDPQFVRMFLDEARVAANIASANVVQTLDIGRTDDGALYIVMELVVGLSLAEMIPLALERGPMPVGVCVEILAQVAMGLHDAHEARTPAGAPLRLVHRDVSPQNVLVGLDGRARLTDFGIAHVTESRLVHTQHGTIKGKFAYVSPEQSRGAVLDARSDVFSLGVVAWEVLAGRRLFARTSPTETVAAVRTADVPSLELVRPGLPSALTHAVARALERDVDGRWQSAREMAEALRDSLGSAGSAPALVAHFVGDLKAKRIVELEARLREAVKSPEIRTLPDIEVSAPDHEDTVLDGPELPTAILAPETEPPPLPAPRAPSRSRALAIGALGIAVAIAGAVAWMTAGGSEDDRAAVAAPRGSEVASPPPAPEAHEDVPAVRPEREVPPEPETTESAGRTADPPSIEESGEAAPPSARRAGRTARSASRSRAQAAPTMEPTETAPTPTTMRLRAGQVLGMPEGL